MRATEMFTAAFLALSVATAGAATVAPFTDAGFTAAQAAGKPVLVFVEASWCPTCAKERPILAELYKSPEFANLSVFDVDFDTAKPLLRRLGVQKQSTLIVYRGKEEVARATGETSPAAIHDLLAKANS
jgi:thioredoxin 1